MVENPLKAALNIAGVWRCDTRCDLKKVDGIIRHGRIRSKRASVSVSLSYKLATERMYSNNESSLPDKVKRNEPERTRGESGRESDKEPGNQTLHANRETFEYQYLMNTYGQGEMRRPSSLTAMMIASESESEALACPYTDNQCYYYI